MQTGLRTQRDATADTKATGQPETRRDRMKLTVFGATGGIGGQVVRQALAAGHEVTAVVRDRAGSTSTIPRSRWRRCPA